VRLREKSKPKTPRAHSILGYVLLFGLSFLTFKPRPLFFSLHRKTNLNLLNFHTLFAMPWALKQLSSLYSSVFFAAFLYLGLGLNSSPQANAAEVVMIDDLSDRIHLRQSVDLYAMADAPLSNANDARSLLSQPSSNYFYPVDLHVRGLLKNIPQSERPAWLRFSLQNTSHHAQTFWLVVDQFIIAGSQLYQVDLSRPVEQRQLTKVERYKQLRQEEHFFRVDLPANSQILYLLSVEREKLSSLHLDLIRPHSVIQDKTFESSYVSTGLGMILLLSLLFYMVAIQMRSLLFFFLANFAITSLGMAIMSFLLKKNWFMEWNQFWLLMIYCFSLLVNVNALLVARQFIRNLRSLKYIDLIVNVALVGIIGVYSYLLIVDNENTAIIWLPFVFTLPVVFYVFTVASFKHKDKSAMLILSTRLIIVLPVFSIVLNYIDKSSILVPIDPMFVLIQVLDLLLLGYCFYISEHRRERHRLQNKQLLQMNEVKHRAQQEVFSQLSQDLRTPISAIIGTSEILKNGDLNHEQLNHLQGIESSAHSVLNKITDIYHRTKSFQESEHVETAPFEIHYLIDQCLESFTTDIKKRSLELIVDVDTNIETVVIGHSFFLRTILTELIETSIRSTSQGHIILKVEYINRDAEKIRFSIEDTGRGIESALLESINEPVSLSQVSPEVSGIDLVKQLLFQLDSKLNAKSQIGEGSHFYFDVYLPSSQIVISSKSLDLSALKSKRLLIVDDNHSYSRVLRVAANSWGLEAKEAFDGTEALALYRAKENIAEPFDAIIIDNDIPNMPALEVIRRIRESGGEMPAVIMLAGFSAAPTLEECKESGIDIILNKPVSQRLIQTTLINLIESQQHQQSLMYSKTRVLIAEDNDVSRRVISKMMDLLDVDYKLVSDGKLAVDAVKREDFDLILMDCEMPVMNGFDAAEAIHKWQDSQYAEKTHIYALTAHVFEEHEERSKHAGMQGFLEKPVQMSALSALIEKHSTF